METPWLCLCRCTTYAPGCCLCCVYARFILRKNSRKSNLILCRGSWPWGGGVPGNHYRRTNWGMETTCVKDPGGGKAEDIEKKWKKRGKERKAHACPCVHTYIASFVWLLLPVGTCSKWKYLRRGTSQPPFARQLSPGCLRESLAPKQSLKTKWVGGEDN